ncbi:MAG: methylated-DNA/protein-cysteinemethyltransferase [Chloroflexi bacterium]|nr:methylated-DNA/protein-cysteinemethyltransferase [Chloroflexota bacterium]
MKREVTAAEVLPAQPVAAWTVVGSPFGPVHVAATDRGVCTIALRSTDEELVAGLRHRLAGEVGRFDRATPAQRAFIEATRAELEEYLAGARRSFDLPLDLARCSAWDREVLEAVRRIPQGETASYGEIARQIGRRGAARAVGGAVGRNPIGLVIPCHRVIAGDGTLGGYGGGWFGEREESLALKRALLAHEGVMVRDPAG